MGRVSFGSRVLGSPQLDPNKTWVFPLFRSNNTDEERESTDEERERERESRKRERSKTTITKSKKDRRRTRKSDRKNGSLFPFSSCRSRSKIQLEHDEPGLVSLCRSGYGNFRGSVKSNVRSEVLQGKDQRSCFVLNIINLVGKMIMLTGFLL
ncbi:uncharacterized protein LOC131311223 [Rhododendron vialii]|uniref:uncharacterized protein LOC131311223 n=1 Tax=Rhododendron vialii TaxID=182163 RepID=UPI00265E6770|nr:uncharacterized protein LOC131311223 [Rhododendron vialii]